VSFEPVALLGDEFVGIAMAFVGSYGVGAHSTIRGFSVYT